MDRRLWIDKFRLRTISLGKIKDMSVKMNKAKKSKRNGNCMSDLLSSPFSPVAVMADLAAGSSAGESAALYTDTGQKRFFGK